MRLHHVFVPSNTLIVGAVIGLSVASVPAARGQAIVTYGVSVGRAAGAGAAAGTGAAGVFDKLNKTTANAANHEASAKPGVKANPEIVPKPASPNAITIGGNKSADAAEKPGILRTASGISIAGLAGPKAADAGYRNEPGEVGDNHNSTSLEQPADSFSEPAGFRQPEVPLPDPAPVASAAPRPSQAPTAVAATAPAVRHEFEASRANPRSASEGAPARVIADGITPKTASTVGQGTITPGTPIQDLIKLLGQPLMRLSGIEGTEYDERYVFLTASGSKLTILAKGGLVLTVIVDER
jgi:hypothetical protein